MPVMPSPNELLPGVIADMALTLRRMEGRGARMGVHETKELGPALLDSFIRAGIAPPLASDRAWLDIAHWSRPTSEVDLVVRRPDRRIEMVAELKACDIGHQLFDLAKVCCLLNTRIPHGFLICVAQREGHFATMPGGELFPPDVGACRQHGFRELIEEHRKEWRHHVGKGSPEPTSVPSQVGTTAVSVGVELRAYPGHSIRAVEVKVIDPTPIPLVDGCPS